MSDQVSGRAFLITGFFTLFMAIMTFNLLVFPACAVDTMETYGIGQAGLTTLASVTSVVGMFGGIIFGPLLDRFGSRKTIMIAMLIGIVLFFVRAYVTSYSLVVVLTFLASLFVGVCQVAAAKVLDTWFTKDKVSVAFAFQAGGAGFGSASVFVVGAALGLHKSLLLVAFAYIVLWICWVMIGKDDVMGNFPSEERLLKGFVAVHECYQDIPCNPCVESCPVHAISMEKLTSPPVIDLINALAVATVWLPAQG